MVSPRFLNPLAKIRPLLWLIAVSLPISYDLKGNNVAKSWSFGWLNNEKLILSLFQIYRGQRQPRNEGRRRWTRPGLAWKKRCYRTSWWIRTGWSQGCARSKGEQISCSGPIAFKWLHGSYKAVRTNLAALINTDLEVHLTQIYLSTVSALSLMLFLTGSNEHSKPLTNAQLVFHSLVLVLA